MNCKPGDLAIIVRATDGLDWALGRIVRVLHLEADGDHGFVWRLEEPFWDLCGRGRYTRIEDICLWPIRPAGDDEPTQETRKLPADAGIQHLRETVRAFRAMRKHGVCP